MTSNDFASSLYLPASANFSVRAPHCLCPRHLVEIIKVSTYIAVYMTILRPVVDAVAVQKRGKDSSAPVVAACQDSADKFWTWAEGRISYHTDAVCESSVSKIAGISSSRDSSDPRMKLILTQSARAPDTFSPFDRMENAISDCGATPVRVRGTSKLTIESIQSSLLMAALGVTTGVVTSDQCRYSIPLKGLDLSILEDLGVRKNLVVIVEGVDSLEHEMFNQLVHLVYSIRSSNILVALVLETDLGEPLIEEVVDDESVFANLAILSIPVLDSRDSRDRISSIFFGAGSEVNLLGLPIQLPEADREFVDRILPSYTKSPSDMCANILVCVSHWFKRSPVSFFVGALLADHKDRDSTIKSVADKLPFKTHHPKILSDLLDCKQSLALAARVLSIAAQSVGLKGSSLPSTEDLLSIRFPAPNPEAVVKKAIAEIQSRKKPSKTIDAIVSDSVEGLNGLERELRRLGVPESEALTALVVNIKSLANKRYNQSKIGDEWFGFFEKFLSCIIRFPAHGSESEKMFKLLSVHAKKDIDTLQADPYPFSPTLDFLRTKPAKNAQLRELHEGVKAVFDNTAAQQIDCEVLRDKFKKVAAEGLDLAESLATMEFLGLIKPPGASDFAVLNGSIKIRKNYRDTWLVPGQKKNGEEEDGDDPMSE